MNNNAALSHLLRELLFATPVRRDAVCKPSENVKAAFEAVKAGDLTRLGRIVRTSKQANWRLPDRGWCLLDEAVKAGSLATVKWLVAHGANANTLFVNDQPCSATGPYCPGLYFSPFATAIREGKVEIAEVLMREGATLNLPCWCHEDGSSQTCFDIAVDFGVWPQLERCLIAQGASHGTTTQPAKRL